MKFTGRLTLLTSILFLLLIAGSARAVNISGTITTTLVITEDSQLVGNVTCGVIAGPCIQFGAPNITLRLNNQIITGPANPDDTTTCNPTSGAPTADLISTGSQNGVQILGPGMVQKSKRHGIFIPTSANVTVRFVTSHHNCFSGIFGNGMTNSLIENNGSVRNSANSGAATCGGNCLINSNNNIIRSNHFSGNGSVCPTATCTADAVTVTSNNDFGVGLIGTSSGNLIELNQIGGNTNGVLIQATATGNTLLRNTILGNPPSQVSRDYRPGGGPVGFDIRDLSPAGANTFVANHCVVYSGVANPLPCPTLSTLLVTTAAAVEVSGRVTTAEGVGLKNVRVWITDGTGSTREVLTSSFGYYSFEDVEAGQSYVIGVLSKRYRFASRVVNVSDTLADVDFVGQE